MSSSLEFKHESSALLRLASPIILSQIAQVLMGLLDTVMSGHAGAFEQAVVGLGVSLWIPVFIGLMSVVQAVSPLIATERPKPSPAAPSEAVSFCCSLQTVPLRVNTYAEPAFTPPGVSPPWAPTMAVSPLIATELPKKSLAAPSEAAVCACSAHVQESPSGPSFCRTAFTASSRDS